MPDGSSSAFACLIVTTSGRILLLWDQDDTLPFRYPQLAMLLASLFHFSQAQSFGHLELQNGFTVLVSSDVAAQISVAIVCATPPTSSRDKGDFPTEVLPLQLARLKSLIILQEFVRCYRADIERLSAEGLEQAKLKAEEYTLTSALGGFDGCDGTLDEFVAFQNDFVGLVMETSARGIQNSIVSWSHDVAASVTESSSALCVARGFLMNAETGDAVYSTHPGSDGGFFDKHPASRRLHHLHKSARVQQSIKCVAKALHESAPALVKITHDAAVVVRFNHLSGKELSELFVALRMLSVSC
ncbi:Stress-induced-phosphoprotein 1 [Phytophthora cinnamomi]|uniref:Stress-induced-phosphoprotein 1 n=1 Tax=Phytophthora cinnamomi TaxID=4785 RepID=UPI003559C42B|nr:Stress-induced-phosphoprotein 1 [Phytophthora cinnamomi]